MTVVTFRSMTWEASLVSARRVGRIVAPIVIVSALGAMSLGMGLVDVLRAALAVLLVLVLPGLLVTSFLFSRFGGVPERAALAVGISLAVMSLGGQLLNLFPTGIGSASWLVLIAVPVTAALLILRFRGREAFNGLPSQHSITLGPEPLRSVLWFVPSLALLTLAVVVSRMGAEDALDTGFTQLWIRPVVADTVIVELGVRSSEHGGDEYRLEMLIDGAVRQQWPSIDLSADQEWHTRVVLSSDQADQAVEAHLYLTDRPDEPYRRVRLQPLGDLMTPNHAGVVEVSHSSDAGPLGVGQ